VRVRHPCEGRKRAFYFQGERAVRGTGMKMKFGILVMASWYGRLGELHGVGGEEGKDACWLKT